MRIPREELFMKIAHLYSERGTCNRAKVGCIITKNNRQVSEGYVGSKPGEPHCIDEGCIIDPNTGGCIRTIHAEENAINFLPKRKQKGYYTLYVTISPCVNCAKKIIDYGIDEVVYSFEYRLKDGIELLKNNNIKVEQYKGRLF